MCDVANLWYQHSSEDEKVLGRTYVNIFACADVCVLFVLRLTYKINSVGSLSMIVCYL